MKPKILIVDDEKDICLTIQRALKKYEDIDSDFTLLPGNALKKLTKENYNMILVDYKMPDMDGMEFLKTILQKKLIENTPVILMTAYGDVQIGMKAIKEGFFDYIIKPFNIENLVFRIKRALEHYELNEKIRVLSQPVSNEFFNIIGKSSAINKIYKIIGRIADQDITILIEGETGTGKEIIAKAIHKASNRKDKVFIPVNCEALTESLLESELFGHEKGAFTGAGTKKYGILETANNGIAFLDEINNASAGVQSKLLRFIETGEFMRVGGTSIMHCNARIIAASNKSIEDLVEEGKFREDLYHRLNIIKIVIPPLRDRKDDIPLLIDYFLDMFNKKFRKKLEIQNNAIDYLTQYSWPGNIRQLKNLIQSTVLLNEDEVIKPEDLPKIIKKQNLFRDDLLSFKKIKNKLITEFEADYFDSLLKKTKGNVSRAAKVGGLNRKHLIEKLKSYKIAPSKYKSS